MKPFESWFSRNPLGDSGAKPKKNPHADSKLEFAIDPFSVAIPNLRTVLCGMFMTRFWQISILILIQEAELNLELPDFQISRFDSLPRKNNKSKSTQSI